MTAAGRAAAIECIAALKEISSPSKLAAAALPLADGAGGLVPICRLHADAEEIVETLARWRVRNMAAYPTQFPVTILGTGVWLREQVLDRPDRILFLVVDVSGTPVGTVGLSDTSEDDRCCRLESVMRGTDEGHGIMTAAVSELLDWTRRELGLEMVWAKVFSDNEPIIRLLHRLGFRDAGLIPLRRDCRGERVEFVPTDQSRAERFHLRLTLQLDAPPARTQHP